jgi:hypothetical protein
VMTRPRRAAPTFTDRRSTEEQLTLGELIGVLEKRPGEQTVCFDFGGLEITEVQSYRRDRLRREWEDQHRGGTA